MSGESHISSLVVHCRPARAEAIAVEIAGLPRMEVHGGIEAAKLIVTYECASEAEIVGSMNAIQLLDGVLAATLVFHHVEPADAGDTSMGSTPKWISDAASS